MLRRQSAHPHVILGFKLKLNWLTVHFSESSLAQTKMSSDRCVSKASRANWNPSFDRNISQGSCTHGNKVFDRNISQSSRANGNQSNHRSVCEVPHANGNKSFDCSFGHASQPLNLFYNGVRGLLPHGGQGTSTPVSTLPCISCIYRASLISAPSGRKE